MIDIDIDALVDSMDRQTIAMLFMRNMKNMDKISESAAMDKAFEVFLLIQERLAEERHE